MTRRSQPIATSASRCIAPPGSARPGHGGQILISQTTQALLEDEEEELPGATQDLGAQRLKDFDRPIKIFQIVVPGLQESFPPLRTLEHTPFEGDEGRLADAARRASRPERKTRARFGC